MKNDINAPAAKGRRHRSGKAGAAFLGPIIAIVFLAALATVGVIFGRKFMEQKRFDQLMQQYRKHKDLGKQAKLLEDYLLEHQEGVFAEKARTMADKLRGFDLVVDCSVHFQNGKTANPEGKLQVLRARKSFESVREAMDRNGKIGALMEAVESGTESPLALFDAIGTFLAKQEMRVLQESVFARGKASFDHLQAGEYVIYGLAHVDSVVVGILDAVQVQAGDTDIVSPKCYFAYHPDAARRVHLMAEAEPR
ncbi:hypothetical protein ACFLSJ_06205 [Verrucomicrobiota bacterium]